MQTIFVVVTCKRLLLAPFNRCLSEDAMVSITHGRAFLPILDQCPVVYGIKLRGLEN